MSLVRWIARHRTTALHALLVRSNGGHAVSELQKKYRGYSQHGECGFPKHYLNSMNVRRSKSIMDTGNFSRFPLGVTPRALQKCFWQECVAIEALAAALPFDLDDLSACLGIAFQQQRLFEPLCHSGQAWQDTCLANVISQIPLGLLQFGCRLFDVGAQARNTLMRI